MTEATPYASRPFDYYTQTKIEGEKMILAYNGKGGMLTVALRPSGIFGEGDPLFVPTVVRNAKAGKMKFILGSGNNLMDFTYVGALLQCAALTSECRCCRVGGGRLPHSQPSVSTQPHPHSPHTLSL